MRRISDEERRQRLVAGHAVGVRDPLTPEDVVQRILALHATDPASISLSTVARSSTATIADLQTSMYETRSLVRVLAMRRTLFVVPRELMPVVQAGASDGVARTLRTRLLKQLETLPTDPVIDDPAAWLGTVEHDIDAALAALGTATGAELSTAVPALRTAFLPTTDKKYDVRRNVTSTLLALLSAEGRIVRVEPRGSWTSRHHTWASIGYWWPDGLPVVAESDARRQLAHRWLEVFGPATLDDLQWWTGWNKGHTKAAVADLDIEAVDLTAGEGIVLRDSAVPEPREGGAALLPALDPTPMGWKHRDWYLADDHRPHLFDNFGNVGPTVWWNGRVVGGWAVRPDGQIVTELFEKIGRTASSAVTMEAVRLTGILDGAAVTPTFPTPLEKSLRTC